MLRWHVQIGPRGKEVILGVLLGRVESVLSLRLRYDNDSSSLLIPVYLEHDRLIHGLDPVAAALPQPPLGDLLHVGDQFGCAVAAAQVGDRKVLGLRAEFELRVLRAKQLSSLSYY